MTEASEFSGAVRELAAAVGEAHADRLENAGLRVTTENRRWADGGEELRVVFWRGDRLVDVLEDFILRDGRPVASLEEFETWLRRGFDTALRDVTPGQT
jgi:hypothetical protein